MAPLIDAHAGDLGPVDKLIERATTLAGAWEARARIATTVGQTQRDLVEAAYTLGASDWGIVKRVLRPDIYLEAMKEIDVTPKIAELQKVTFGDGTTFDAGEAEKYAKSFAIHSMS